MLSKFITGHECVRWVIRPPEGGEELSVNSDKVLLECRVRSTVKRLLLIPEVEDRSDLDIRNRSRDAGSSAEALILVHALELSLFFRSLLHCRQLT